MNAALEAIAERHQSALLVGAGPGLGGSLIRLFAAEGMAIALAARSPDKLGPLCAETGATAYACDVADANSVFALFAALDKDGFAPDLVIFNPSRRLRGPLVELDHEEVRQSLLVNCYGGFLVGQQAARRMLARGRGSIFFTGASASMKGYPQSAPFAMGKFGLRGLAESMARELQPRNIHFAHFVIDGSISKGPGDDRAKGRDEDALLAPSAIAETFLHVHRQPRSAWIFEVALRPWLETFRYRLDRPPSGPYVLRIAKQDLETEMEGSIRQIRLAAGALTALLVIAISLMTCLIGASPSTAAPLSADERQRFAFSVLVTVQDMADQVPKISAENADDMKNQQSAVVRSGTLDDYRSLAGQNQFLLWKVNTRINALSTALNKLVRGRFPDLTAEMEEWKVVVEQLRENDTAVAVDHLHRSGVIAKPVRIDGETIQSVFTDRYNVAYGDIVEPFIKGALKK